MEPRIMVTGATGTVGGEVVRQLCERGVAPVALVNSAEKGAALAPGCADVRVADLRDETALRGALREIGALFMLTPVTPDQVALGEHLVRLAGEAGVERIVKLSIIDAEREPGVALARWHREMERLVEDSGIAWTFLRPAGFMQMMAGFYGATIPAQGKFFLPCGEAPVCKVDTRDVAAVAVVALTSDACACEALTLTGPEPLTYYELARLMSAATSRLIEYVDVPEPAARVGLEQMGVPEPLLSAFMELWAKEKCGDAAEVTGEVERVTGKPARCFADFARDYAAAWAPPATGGPAPA